MNRNLRTVPAAAATLVLVAAACSDEGGRQDEGGADVDTPEMTIAMVTHQVEGDTFWDIVRSGAEDAAAKSDVTLEYSADPEAAEQATLVRNAVDQGVDGIVVTLAKPEALQEAIDAAHAADIPVVGINAGIEHWEDAGLLEYFGADETAAGEAYGERLGEVDARHALCVVHEQGHVDLEERCSALQDAFDGESDTLYVDGSSMSDVSSGITARLQEDDSIDHVATLGAPYAMTAIDAVADAGSDVAVATFDTNPELVEAIRGGDVEWAVDQQPYLQGYLSVDGLWLYNTNGNVSGGGDPVLTGPAFVDQDNIDEVAEYAEEGTR